MGEQDGNRNKDNHSSWESTSRQYQENNEDMKIWGILIFGLIGATATTAAVSQLRRTFDWVYTQLIRSRKGATGGSFRSAFQEEAWRRYNRRMQEEHEEEMERVERIRRMQKVFYRERNKQKRSYETWKEYGPGTYHQNFQRNDWYWKTDSSFRDHSNNYQRTPREPSSYPLSHHYTVLGLDRSRKTPYTDAEIKTAFRAKAMEYHPDQNQGNKEAAEVKFKEVMVSYEAIKQERTSKS